MTTVCNIWMICLELNWFVYDPSWMCIEFVWTLRSSVLVVFNNFLLIDATNRSNISSNQKRLFFAASLYPLSFFANTPFKITRKVPVTWLIQRIGCLGYKIHWAYRGYNSSCRGRISLFCNIFIVLLYPGWTKYSYNIF